MSWINEDLKIHDSLLLHRLEETANPTLTLRLEDTMIVQQESNAPVHTIAATTSNLPDEILAMIFEAAMHPDETNEPHFGVLVSHVSSHWRKISLGAPQLWSRLCFFRSKFSFFEPNRAESTTRAVNWTARATAFLSRSKMSPLDISVIGFRLEDFSAEFLELICSNMARCRRLSIIDAQPSAFSRAIASFCIPVPILSSIHFSLYELFGDSDTDPEFEGPVFPFGAPQLKTVQLDDINVRSLHFALPAFASVTSLQLTTIYINDTNPEAYNSLRDALMSLRSLHHLELQLEYVGIVQFRLPIVLPTIRFLRLDACQCPLDLDGILRSFEVASLTALSLEGWYGEAESLDSEDDFTSRFPALVHLILLNFTIGMQDLDTLAQRFPHIKRLTCQAAIDACSCDISYILDPWCDGPRNNSYRRVVNRFRWPKLENIAVSANGTPLDARRLYNTISQLKAHDGALRKLFLPKTSSAQVDVDYMDRGCQIDSAAMPNNSYAQNANIFSKRMGAIRKSCGKDLELVFVDAPVVLQPADIAGFSSQDLGAAEASTTDPALTPRGWWVKPTYGSDGKILSLDGLQESLLALRDILKADRYEGVFGFSQGAAVAALLAALVSAVSGFKCHDPLGDVVLTPFYSTPTLHVIGRTDIIVIDERSRALLAVSENKRLEEHDGGHFVPSKSNWRNFFRDYLRDPLGNVPSPSAYSSSAPASGTATPTGPSSSAPFDGNKLKL
ncbi:hypothetical protein HWV62_44007 [Athelia sp. TMB]|nr:hypothetical protein HWV62_44007 [Athelia sp. TMB]